MQGTDIRTLDPMEVAVWPDQYAILFQEDGPDLTVWVRNGVLRVEKDDPNHNQAVIRVLKLHL